MTAVWEMGDSRLQAHLPPPLSGGRAPLTFIRGEGKWNKEMKGEGLQGSPLASEHRAQSVLMRRVAVLRASSWLSHAAFTSSWIHR